MTASLLRIMSRLPLWFLYPLSYLVYLVGFHIVRYRRDVVGSNLANAFPHKNSAEIARMARQFYRNYASVLVEMIKSVDMSGEEFDRRVTIDGLELLSDYLDAGQSVIVLMAHQCNLEWTMLASGNKLGYPIDVIYKPMHDKEVDELLLQSRSRFGCNPVPPKSAIVEIAKRRKIVRCIAMAPDQAPRQKDDKYWTRFMNQDTAFFLGIEKIARMTRYPVVFMDSRRTSRGHYQASIKLLAVPPYKDEGHIITDLYATTVETQILQDPTDWLWSHKRWKYKKPLYQ